nr:neutral/alkaline non-lysosomal ceramidase N-terminal domain-containing protein [Chryseolinea sp.]
MVKKTIRFVLIFISSFIGVIILFLLISIVPLDRTPYKEKPFYAEMMTRLDSLLQKPPALTKAKFNIGFAKESITPRQRVATAGYGNRKGKLIEGIHDSVFVRAMVVQTNTSKVAIVSADLLILPPTVVEVLKKRLPEIGFTINNTYLGAIHTHNSIGHWAGGATQIMYGEYKDSIVNFIADKIIASIHRATQNTLPSTLKVGQVPIRGVVKNRIIDGGPVDSLLRVIEVHRSDSSKLILMSHAAHATCLYSRDIYLSRDYPGKLVDTMEQQGYTFAMFMAGAVGSHGCKPPEFGLNCIDYMANEISLQFMANRNKLHDVQDSTLIIEHIGFILPESQVKISKDWGIRPWLFWAALGEFPVYLNALRLGDVVMLGTPSDFSGEFNYQLDTLAEQHHLQAMVTSFNGGYIGYVTPLKYYDVDHYETRLMNWYGPGTG